jgi:SMI1-KNR4 cell-wall
MPYNSKQWPIAKPYLVCHISNPTMDWKQFISQLDLGDKHRKYDFNFAATNADLLKVLIQFDLTELPEELVDLYQQSNGINEMLNDHKIGELIWPIERIIATNKEYRYSKSFKELYMSFEQLFFVSDAGNGDLFGFVTINGKFGRNDIFVWSHENDSRTWVAPNLAKFIEWWTDGTIVV